MDIKIRGKEITIAQVAPMVRWAKNSHLPWLEHQSHQDWSTQDIQKAM